MPTKPQLLVLLIGPIYQCMNKFNRIVAKTQKGLMEMEVEEGEEEQSMFQMVGRLASFFAKNINEGRDFQTEFRYLD